MNQALRTFEQCPGCGAATSNAKCLFKIFFLGQDCQIFQCSYCSLVYKEFAPIASELAKIYSDDYVHFKMASLAIDRAELNSAKQKIDRCQKLLCTEKNPENLRLLDIGCGAGYFVEIALSLGYFAEGIDPYLPDNLKSSCLQKKSPDSVLPNSYDIAFLLNVVEHLDEPIHIFSAVKRLLKPGGVMLLTCPYGDSLARRYYQGYWGHLALDEHILFWTPRALTRLLRELGFRGKISYRIAGSPFPYGRVKLPTVVPKLIESYEQRCFENSSNSRSLSEQIWQLARTIQRQEGIANLVRYIVHLTHTGDYLEYAISVGK